MMLGCWNVSSVAGDYTLGHPHRDTPLCICHCIYAAQCKDRHKADAIEFLNSTPSWHLLCSISHVLVIQSRIFCCVAPLHPASLGSHWIVHMLLRHTPVISSSLTLFLLKAFSTQSCQGTVNSSKKNCLVVWMLSRMISSVTVGASTCQVPAKEVGWAGQNAIYWLDPEPQALWLCLPHL